MNSNQFPIVGNTPILETHNYDEAYTLLSHLIGPHQSHLTDSPTTFFTRFYHAALHQSRMIYMQWCGKQQITRKQPEELYVLYIPLEGTIQEKINNHSPIYSSVSKAHIFTPQQNLIGSLSARGQGISICIPQSLLEDELTKLLNHSLQSPLTFSPELDLTTTFGESLKRLILFAWQETQNPSLFLPQLEQILLNALLKYQPHNYSAELLSYNALPSQRQIHLAKEFMLANLQNPINLGDIATALNISGRSLQRAFARHHNCTPKQFLTELRLQAIHQELKLGYFGSINQLMLKYQLHHSGRYSQNYKKLFGESPSQTLGRYR